MLGDAGLAVNLLVPDVAELGYAKALVVEVVAGKVAVRLEPLLRAAAVEEVLFVLTHYGA